MNKEYEVSDLVTGCVPYKVRWKGGTSVFGS